ncbi:substrate-binding domain-containing protein [Rhizobium sullae]|uniref:Substrate-binding domain-containing protein n=1 Tax=Rhizobium sullae TaxID=50338 RepID=A0A2N0DCC0_RHISU|nr:substrate-binding domain-containing protein [Rhizobium sullae]PKA43755.1 sugar ABC transporter substrate-binding protein [Rhizobium sullae]UWU16794.1 substrate-binding domain-containing protein [Rhizobium sullae]
MNRTIKRRTFTVALGFTALAAASLAGLGAKAQEKTFALVQINQQALFFNQMNEGAQKAADAAGAKLVIFNANNDPAAQNSAIETYIQQKVAGLAVVAIDVNGIMPAVKQAADAGIPVVAIDAILPDGPQKAQIGVDNAKAGADMGKFFLDYVKANMDGKVKIGVVGALNSFIQNVRQEGFEKTLEGVSGIEKAGVVDGQNIQDNALAAAENLITGNPDMTAVYATGEPALMGAIAAVESQGKQDTIKVFGWDLTAQAIAGIDAGYVAAVIQQDPAAMGAAAVDALKKISDGGSVEKNIAIPVTIVTKENVEPYRAVFK